MAKERGAKWAAGLAAAGLLGVFATLALSSTWERSRTFDEGFYISGGYGYVETGDPTMAGWFHPVLAPTLAGLGLTGMELEDPRHLAGWDEEMMVYAPTFMNENRTEAQTILRGSRPAFVGVGVLLGAGVFWWSRRLFGLAGGIVSLMMFAIEPNMLAHAGLATTDILLAATMFWATFAFLEHLRRPRLWKAAAAGVLAGAAMLTKTSALLMFPGWVVLGVVYLARPARQGEGASATTWCERVYERFWGRAGVLAGSVLIMAGLATATIGAAYGFRYGAKETPGTTLAAVETGTANESAHAWPLRVFEKARGYLPVPRAYLETVGVFLDKGRTGHPGYLFGEVGGPWWYYYPVTYVLKTPLGLMGLVALALVTLPWSTRARWGLELLAVPVFFLAGCMTSSVDTGFRHVLPMAPFLLVLAGSLATVRFRGVRVMHVIVAGLVVWAALSSLAVYPDYLAYFNEAAGGPDGGWRYLGDSNLDWGQDVGKLERFVKERGIKEPVRVFLHTMTPVERLPFAAEEGRRYQTPTPGWYAVSMTEAQRIYEDSRRDKALKWLEEYEPVATLGHTIRVYHIGKDGTGE